MVPARAANSTAEGIDTPALHPIGMWRNSRRAGFGNRWTEPVKLIRSMRVRVPSSRQLFL